MLPRLFRVRASPWMLPNWRLMASAALRAFSNAASAAVSCGERGGGSSAIDPARDEMFELRSEAKIPLYELVLDEDTNSRNGNNTQWYFFKVMNTRAGQTVDFSIVNLGKQSSLYERGLRPLAYSHRAA